MHIWILLKHKYLRTSAVDIEDRRFLYEDMCKNSDDEDEQQEE